MDVDDEMRRKIVASVAGSTLFVVVLIWIGATFYSDGFSATGGLALVGAIVGFVFLMAGVGLFLARSAD